jgi:hypothetical protein
MKLSNFHALQPIESKSLLYEDVPRAKFAYTNYQQDPRPDVFAMSRQTNPDTGNDLVYGINLNYLSKDQLRGLLEVAPQVVNVPEAKRYDALKYLAPDLTDYYRSYNNDYMHEIEASDLSGYMNKMVDEPELYPADKERVKTRELVKDVEQDIKVDKAKEREDGEDEYLKAARKSWETDRRLHDPDTGEINDPDDTPDSFDGDSAEKYIQSRGKDIDRRAEVERLANQIDDLDNFDDELETRDEIGDLVHQLPESVQYYPSVGFVWGSPDNYIKYHSPNEFIRCRDNFGSILEHSFGSSMFGVYDLISNKLVIDIVRSPKEILHEAGWGSSHTVLFEKSGDDMIVLYQCGLPEDVHEAVRVFSDSIAPVLISESA